MLYCSLTQAAPQFKQVNPEFNGHYKIDAKELCLTAKNTLDYLNKGKVYDPSVIHDGTALKIPLSRVKNTLRFICTHQNQMNNPAFVKKHFEFIRWYPDIQKTKALLVHKTLLKNLPLDHVLMTKYYVHLAKVSTKEKGTYTYPLYGLPKDEQNLTLEQANKKSNLTRFKYGKQSILKGALKGSTVPILAYLSRDDLEAALLQGTLVADFGPRANTKIFNVHRGNNIPYNKQLSPYEQERFWYFKEVDGVKGYGKDAEHKITVYPLATFAADLAQFGLGKLLMIQYSNKAQGLITRAGVLADTGGAFADNLYQIDYLAGSFSGKTKYLKGTSHLPDYVQAYFMVLKDSKS